MTRGNNGLGNNEGRDSWETPGWLFGILNKQYDFSFDCCATVENTKVKKIPGFSFSSDFEKTRKIRGPAWMNPPFSKAQKMFEHFFKVVLTGVSIYRSDNLETRLWQDIILEDATWVFIVKGRIQYEGQEGNGARFPSALIGINIEPPEKLEGRLLEL
jgi:hypothetical protein